MQAMYDKYSLYFIFWDMLYGKIENVPKWKLILVSKNATIENAPLLDTI